MHLQEPHLTDFIKAYEHAFNERITPAQAHELYARLLNLYAAIRRVPTDNDPTAPPATEIQM